MARQASLQGKLKKLLRRYKHISPERFLYNEKKILRQRFQHLRAWFLIHDETRGYSIMLLTFRRKDAYSVKQWAEAFQRPEVVGKKSLFAIYTEDVLPAINTRSGASWKFKNLIGWTGDIPRAKDTDISPKSNKVKKRNAKPKHKHRRR